jgi:hypothetical protein
MRIVSIYKTEVSTEQIESNLHSHGIPEYFILVV